MSEVFGGNGKIAPYLELELQAHLRNFFDYFVFSGSALRAPFFLSGDDFRNHL